MPELISRSQALASGALYYFTGEPCKRGHVAPRLTSTCACEGCRRRGASDELLALIASGGIIDRHHRSKDIGARNVEQVRSYLEKNLGCSQKEAARALRLSRWTVARAVCLIREQQKKACGAMMTESLDAFERRAQAPRHFRGDIHRGEWVQNENYTNIAADGYSIRVFVNGREYDDWRSADSEQGVVVTNDGAILKGQVEIRLERRPPCATTSSSDPTENCLSSI